MKQSFYLLLCLIVSGMAHAQQRPPALADTSFFRPSLVPGHLKPIERGAGFGAVYYYGGRRLGSAQSLEIPFYELNDPTVLRHFHTHRLLNQINTGLSLVPLLYLLSSGRSRVSGSTYWTIYGVSVGASLTLGIVSNSQVRRAVTAYNRRLAGVPSLGMAVEPTLPWQPVVVGPAVSWRF